ncbi:NADH-quinone oxidoreductase subunit A [Thermodesulfatator atlanticus]|uniref:NADH-quinone oxidoreductase subunit A n=1 Tax=Thermodesulfatator atlanticus TaxID=501497 RepID=UPI0003B4BC8F|nr:NADH-quinone oxidoreductase subunit A [Thermodesulfatator atlanticus]
MELSLSLKYIPILITALIVFAIGAAMVIINWILAPKRPYPEKAIAYECGLPPTGEPRHRFDVKFYAIAILFVVFDVEAVFLYPWATTFDQIGFFAYVEMVVFIALLLVAYFYAWIRGAFQWD